MMCQLLHRCAQATVLALIAVLLGWLSVAPGYRPFAAGQALVKLSFSHGAPRQENCHRLSVEELARLPPNMRRPVECPRRRRDVLVEMFIDGRIALRAALPPSGIAGDGPSRIYQRFPVPAGVHELRIGLRDTARFDGFDYEFSRRVELAQYQNLVIDFAPTSGGFYIR